MTERVFFNSDALSIALLMAIILAASSLASDSCNAFKIRLFKYIGNKASRIWTGSYSNCKIGEKSDVSVLETPLSTVNFPSFVVNLKNSSSAASTHTPFTSQISAFGDIGSKVWITGSDLTSHTNFVYKSSTLSTSSLTKSEKTSSAIAWASLAVGRPVPQ